ncbi:MAG: sigma-70 family RNA polymerase sigma factor [Planctomycetes bacterium]|nr:sigma-70 family RNA polymerase sigma factor [Planctomycetota bacterium]
MPEDLSFSDLMARLRAGDQDAAAQVFQRFARQLMTLARRRLDPHLRQKIDPEDVLQSAFRSFFVRNAEGDFDLANWDVLWGMLALITARKCAKQADYYHAQRRDVRREAEPALRRDESEAGWEAPDHEPTPAEAAVLDELVEELMHGLSDKERPILGLRLQGYSVGEIAAQVGRTERTVQRVLQRLRQRVERLYADGESVP